MEEKKRCADCRKWDYTSNNFGFCRASAPAPGIQLVGKSDFTLVWPSTGMDDWCFEFEPTTPEETIQ